MSGIKPKDTFECGLIHVKVSLFRPNDEYKHAPKYTWVPKAHTQEYKKDKSTWCPNQAVIQSCYSSFLDPIKMQSALASLFQEPKTWLLFPSTFDTKSREPNSVVSPKPLFCRDVVPLENRRNSSVCSSVSSQSDAQSLPLNFNLFSSWIFKKSSLCSGYFAFSRQKYRLLFKLCVFEIRQFELRVFCTVTEKNLSVCHTVCGSCWCRVL